MGSATCERGFAELVIGNSIAVRRLRAMITKVAASDVSVLLAGPSGSGKELVAQAIHAASERQGGAFVAVNSGAIPADLIESELFGHEKGSFTGAHARRTGHFENAHKGTLFLDEIGDMRFDMQVKLLRVLEERVVTRVGSSAAIPVDVRIVSATHRDMDRAIADGGFRQDLYFRLGVVVIHVPSLAERVEDIALLIRHFQKGRPIDLRQEIEAIECDRITMALELADGIVSDAARLLTLKRTTLIEKMRKYGVQVAA
jgi:sigma-54 specific flagellar transcriptional regulator A